MKSILLLKKFWGLAEMTSGLARMASCKNDFLCTLVQNSNNICPDCKQTDSRTLNASLTTPDG